MQFDRVLKQRFWLAVLGLLAIAAYFQADGISALVGSALSASGKALARTASAPAPPAPATGSPRDQSGRPILKRNPFDSVTGSLLDQPTGDARTAKPGPLVDPLAAPKCDGVQVHGTTVAKNPMWSMAMVQGPGEPHGKLRRVGDSVAAKTIAYIGDNPEKHSPSVWLTGNGNLCQSILFSKEKPKARRPKPQAHRKPRKKGRTRRRGPPKLPAKIAQKIKKIGPNEFDVDRSAIDMILAQHAQLMHSVRVSPDQKNGHVAGIRVLNVRPDTLLGKLGFKNGDRIDSINGFNLSSPEKALQAYARLRTASNISVKIKRGGKASAIDFHVK
jgi:general secretion pathway protein C